MGDTSTRGTRRTTTRSRSTLLEWESEMVGCPLTTMLAMPTSSTRLDLWTSEIMNIVCLSSKTPKISSTEDNCTKRGNHGTTSLVTSSTKWTVATTTTLPSVTLTLLKTTMKISATWHRQGRLCTWARCLSPTLATSTSQ